VRACRGAGPGVCVRRSFPVDLALARVGGTPLSATITAPDGQPLYPDPLPPRRTAGYLTATLPHTATFTLTTTP
jgi:hypothetical protein